MKALKDIVEFCKDFLNFNPKKYQVPFLKCKDKRIVIKMSRQSGKSTITAAKALHFAFTFDNATVVLIARNQRQSGLLLKRMAQLIRQGRVIRKYVKRQTMTELEFDNGSLIVALPSGQEGVGIKGYTADMVIIDEAALVPEEVFAAVSPMLATTNGDLIYLSTPFGKIGKFYDAFHSKNFTKFSSSWKEAVASGLQTKSFIDTERDEMTDIQFTQEYEAEFVEESDTWFTMTEIKNAIAEYETERNPEKWYYLGVDFARYGADETVYIVVERDATDFYRVVHIDATAKKPLTDAIGRIKALNEEWHFESILVDETGLGGGPTDILLESGLPIEAISFTSKSKEEMYKNLKLLFQRGNLKIPDNRNLTRQLCDLRYEYTSTGMLRLTHSDRGHDDFCFVAGTKILTNKGQVSIERIKVGDKVMTRKGYKKVTAIGNRIADVIERFGLTGTPEHPFITPNGIEKFINVSGLTYIWNEKQSCIEEKNITDTPILKDEIIEFITMHILNGKKLPKHYTGRFGKTTLEKYLKDISYITKMEIHSIINQKIWNVLIGENINLNIKALLKLNGNHGKILKNMQDLKQLLGINQKKEENGIKNNTKILLQKLRNMNIYVKSAIRNIFPHERKKQDFVQSNAKEKIIGKRRVYNISVEDCNEYFANNILVHNCDALALACFAQSFGGGSVELLAWGDED